MFRFKPFKQKIKVVGEKGCVTRSGNSYDIAMQREFVSPRTKVQTVNHFEDRLFYINLGVKIQIPQYYGAVLHSRSSTPKYWGVCVSTGFGEIESDYAGDWHFPVYKAINKRLEIPKGTRICQFKLELLNDAPWYARLMRPFTRFEIEYVDHLETTRGGLGSTGK